MHFTSLKLTGFKSFLETTELEIAPGLTGVVGPNGCGKSNLVEALRWVMGESSAKRMRGGEMDDVIFGGSDKRPARNLAEVSLHLDNASRTAPAQFNSSELLEVTRRIERGSGSDYKVNGKSARAKDVSLLFQDNGTGPHSASLVSQGRIGALIAAKPTEKRVLLEEAAGITGLHTRRHEAELRLKQAETNLTRVEDVMGTMDAQLQLLKRQARQASRYRNINGEVRRQEAALLHIKWMALELALQDAHEAFVAAESQVADLMLKVAESENARLAAAETITPLRQSETVAAATLQRLVIAREQIDQESRQIKEALEQAASRKQEAEADRLREMDLAEDARRALESILREETELTTALAQSGPEQAQLAAKVEQAMVARQQVEGEADVAQKALNEAEASKATLERRLSDLNFRFAKANERLQQFAVEQAKLEAEQLSDLFVSGAKREVEQASDWVARSEQAIQTAEATRNQFDGEISGAKAKLNEAKSAQSSLQSEVHALQRVLQSKADGGAAPVLDQVSAQAGYEQALAAAFGEDMALSLEQSAASYWSSLPPLSTAPSLPFEAKALSQFVTVPEALSRRLQTVGLVEDAATASRLAAQLLPGQCLVTKDGGAWRWDGVVSKPGAPTITALRLQQRNRLVELEGELKQAEAAVVEAEAAYQQVQAQSQQAATAVQAARADHNAALSEFNRTRKALAEAEAAMTAQASKLASLAEAKARVQAEVDSLSSEKLEAEQQVAGLPELGNLREQMAELRAKLADAQRHAAEAEAELRQFRHVEQQRQSRVQQLQAERVRWEDRAKDAGQHLEALEQRAKDAEAELQELSGKPAQLEQKRINLVSEIETAEESRRQAADALAVGETTLREAETALRQAESRLGDVREQRASANAEVANVQATQESLRERILEKCECAPEALFALAELEEGQPMPEPEAIEARLNKLLRERDALGPVNLRAEQEAEEQQGNIDKMNSEKAELIEAIAKLRGAISSLNKEARERLIGAFDKVQGHFKRLFAELFGGGNAELKLTDADDPLEAGLEVIASPPGKKLQNLSLLSGGEQALTSLALLFAVFLVNPSPICVLDEVDAPLDEANIDRFCNLLDLMAKEGTTRFLVITHQRLTMSRMDRLYGVTMMERGVSRLVSVDLNTAAEYHQAA